jgi:hypothetical protein
MITVLTTNKDNDTHGTYTHSMGRIAVVWWWFTYVVRKWSLHTVPSNQLGTWMEVFVVSDPIDFDAVSAERRAYLVRQWAMLYKYFDETTWETQSYLYGFGKHEDANARQTVLEKYGVTVEQHGKFIWASSIDVDCVDFGLLDAKEEMLTALFGVALVYGSWKFWSDGTTLEKIDLTIPNSAEFQGPWRQIVSMLEQCRWQVWEQYLGLSVDTHWSDRAYCTITIADRVILEYFIELLWDEHCEVPAWDRMIHYLNMLLDQHWSDQIEGVLDWNEVRLLKIHSK